MKFSLHPFPMIPLAMGAGLMISPDNLVFLGNFTGNAGFKGIGLILFWALFYIFLSPAISPIPFGRKSTGPRPGMNFRDRMFAVVLGFAALLMPTGILVSSGFAFNEIFLYWFPNFGFAFLLLALVLGINLFGIEFGQRVQLVFLLLSLTPLAVLGTAGLLTGPEVPIQAPGHLSPAIWFAPLLLWKGFDLAGFAPAPHPFIKTIVLGACIFLVWALASLFHTPLDKLSATSLPHLKTARLILGDSGRYLMGGAIIFSTLSAVNALFLSSRLLAVRIKPWPGRPFIIPALLAAGIGLMMASGMAGSEKLEIWIQAVSIVWIIIYGLNAGAFARKAKSVAHAFAAGLIFLGAGLMGFYSPDKSWLLVYIAVILASALVTGFVPPLIKRINKKELPHEKI